MKNSRIYISLLLAIFLTACNKDSTFDIFDPDFEVFVLLPSEGLGDRSFADVIYEGVETTSEDFNFSINYIIPESLMKGEEWISNIPQLKGDLNIPPLIIVAGSQFIAAVDRLSGDYGESKVLLLGGNTTEYEGLASVIYRTYAASYIGGYLSAQKITNCRAISIAGFDATFLTEYQQGFEQGVIDAGGTINETVFLSSGLSGFEIPDTAYILTNSLLPDNDLIFALSSGSNLGIINAARNFSEQRYVIGTDADQSWMGLTVVTGSVVKLFGLDIYNYIDEFSQGSFESGNFIRSMKDRESAFLINNLVLGNIEIPEDLLKTAIEKENLLNQ